MENKSKRVCSHCGARLNGNAIQRFVKETTYYNLYLEDDLLRQEPDEPESNKIEDEGFCCRECGANLSLSEEEVIEILKEV